MLRCYGVTQGVVWRCMQQVQGDDAEALDGKLLAMAEVLGHSRDKLSAHGSSAGHPGPSQYLSSMVR